MRDRLVAMAAVLALAGCSAGPPTDAAAVAVSDARAAVASLVLAVELRLNERSTDAYTQVILQTERDAVADAQRELATADDAGGPRRDVAEPVLSRAASALSRLAGNGAGALNQEHLQELRALEADLVRAADALGR